MAPSYDVVGRSGRTIAFQGPGLYVTLTMRPDGEVDGFTVHADDAQTITARLLRTIPFGELAAMARRDQEPPENLTAMVGSLRCAREQEPRPGRHGRPDRYYAELAVAYEQWVGTGEPLRVLADQLLITPLVTLRTALQTARNRGLLTDAPRGRKGGRATDKARQLLDV
jgi:hypothetical protein